RLFFRYKPRRHDGANPLKLRTHSHAGSIRTVGLLVSCAASWWIAEPDLTCLFTQRTLDSNSDGGGFHGCCVSSIPTMQRTRCVSATAYRRSPQGYTKSHRTDVPVAGAKEWRVRIESRQRRRIRA